MENSIGADREYRWMRAERKSNVFSQSEENVASLKTEMGLKEVSGSSENLGKSPKAKFRIFGEEMIEKQVKPSGNTGRVYLPLDWVGKFVKIIRID
jgi:putative transposon-encoded protein